MKMLSWLRANWWHPSWRVPIFSGLLIVIALALEKLGGGAWNVQLLHEWLVAPGHAHSVSSGFTLADAFMLAATIVAGWGIVRQAISAMRVLFFGIDLLVSVAAIGAIIIGNFWEAAAVTFLFALGHSLEFATMNKTRSALAQLIAIAPDQATVLTEVGPKEVPAHLVEVGQTVLVTTGDNVPVDGTVTSGRGAIDQSTITGESMPAQKESGDQVFAGTICAEGLLEIEATGVGAQTTLARIIRRVEEAQDAKAPTQALIDRIARWYTPGVIIIALITGFITRDVVLALTLLVIGCPGALVISIPVAVVAGIGRAAREGILIKGGEYLETSAKINAIAFDKTGTLTENRPAVTGVAVLAAGVTREDLLSVAALAEVGSNHPLARPILEAAKETGFQPTGAPAEVEMVPGKGIVVQVDSAQIDSSLIGAGHDGTQQISAGQLVEVLVGNAGLLEQYQVDREALKVAGRRAEEFASAGQTPALVAVGGRLLGVLAITDQMRAGAPEMAKELRQEGVKRLVMLTGDAPQVAQGVGDAVGLDSIHASLLPEDKLEAVQQLQAEGFTVAMVGDGVNDAPALATADIGVAMGAAGSGVATETADIALMADDLQKLPEAIRLAKRTRAVMVQNIWVAFVTVGVLLAGVFGGAVTMALGMAVHEGSVMVVILNAMRLSR